MDGLFEIGTSTGPPGNRAATGGSLVRAVVIGAFFFVAATAWSWRRWRERLREDERRRT